MNSDDFIYGDLPVLRADRQPCIVCGHPTGDCTGETHPPVRILGVTNSETLKESADVLIEEDIWDYAQITPFTKAKVLLYKKGQHVSYETAKELGII